MKESVNDTLGKRTVVRHKCLCQMRLTSICATLLTRVDIFGQNQSGLSVQQLRRSRENYSWTSGLRKRDRAVSFPCNATLVTMTNPPVLIPACVCDKQTRGSTGHTGQEF